MSTKQSEAQFICRASDVLNRIDNWFDRSRAQARIQEGADGGTQFSVNYNFFGQISVHCYFFCQFSVNY